MWSGKTLVLIAPSVEDDLDELYNIWPSISSSPVQYRTDYHREARAHSNLFLKDLSVIKQLSKSVEGCRAQPRPPPHLREQLSAPATRGFKMPGSPTSEAEPAGAPVAAAGAAEAAAAAAAALVVPTQSAPATRGSRTRGTLTAAAAEAAESDLQNCRRIRRVEATPAFAFVSCWNER